MAEPASAATAQAALRTLATDYPAADSAALRELLLHLFRSLQANLQSLERGQINLQVPDFQQRLQSLPGLQPELLLRALGLEPRANRPSFFYMPRANAELLPAALAALEDSFRAPPAQPLAMQGAADAAAGVAADHPVAVAPAPPAAAVAGSLPNDPPALEHPPRSPPLPPVQQLQPIAAPQQPQEDFSEAVALLVSMGFSAEAALLALQSCSGRADQAVAMLCSEAQAVETERDHAVRDQAKALRAAELLEEQEALVADWAEEDEGDDDDEADYEPGDSEDDEGFSSSEVEDDDWEPEARKSGRGSRKQSQVTPRKPAAKPAAAAAKKKAAPAANKLLTPAKVAPRRAPAPRVAAEVPAAAVAVAPAVAVAEPPAPAALIGKRRQPEPAEEEQQPEEEDEEDEDGDGPMVLADEAEAADPAHEAEEPLPKRQKLQPAAVPQAVQASDAGEELKIPEPDDCPGMQDDAPEQPADAADEDDDCDDQADDDDCDDDEIEEGDDDEIDEAVLAGMDPESRASVQLAMELQRAERREWRRLARKQEREGLRLAKKLQTAASAAASGSLRRQDSVAEAQDRGAIVALLKQEAERQHRPLRRLEANYVLLPAHRDGAEYECVVCYSDVPIDELLVADCGHYLCAECFLEFVRANLTSGNCLELKCPNVKPEQCPHLIGESEIRRCEDPELLQGFVDRALQETLKTVPDCRFCPKPDCGTPMLGQPDEPMMRCPVCRFCICFNCRVEWHSDTSCVNYQRWREENEQADDKFDRWRKKHTKPCPKCNSDIQKNGGCNHMTCSSCRFQFCWLCMNRYTARHFSNRDGCKQFT